MRKVGGLILALIISSTVDAKESFIKAEVTSTVKMSNTDVNRIHCTAGKINDVILSEEKGVTVKIVDSNVFVKFLVKVLNGRETFVKKHTEFHVVCNGEIYTLIAKPRKGRPATIRLGSDKKHTIQKNLAMFKGMAREEAIVKLTLDMLRDDASETYQTTDVASAKQSYKDIYYKAKKDVRVDGVGLNATEYVITAKRDLPHINEKYFIASEFGSSIEAITLLPQPIKKGQKARLIVVKGKFE